MSPGLPWATRRSAPGPAFFLVSTQEYAVWVAVTIYAYDHGGAGVAGAVLVAMLLPAALVARVAATFGDRVRRDRALGPG